MGYVKWTGMLKGTRLDFNSSRVPFFPSFFPSFSLPEEIRQTARFAGRVNGSNLLDDL